MLPMDLLAALMLDEQEEQTEDKSHSLASRFGSVSFSALAQQSIMSNTKIGISMRPNGNLTTVPIQEKSEPVSLTSTGFFKTQELCVFAMVGKCRFGSVCKNIHGLQCPRCLLYCLHPHDIDSNEEHLEKCLGANTGSIGGTTHMAEIECGICMERVAQKEDPRFGLLDCEHAFCLGCIRQWRSKHTMSELAIRSCPLCRIVTYFIIPSSTWIALSLIHI